MVQAPISYELLGQASAIIGDALYNLRSSLDYLVYTLAVIWNNHEHVEKTQFPIDDHDWQFEAHRTGKWPDGKKAPHYLKKVPDAAIPLLRKLQPFEGCEWTRTLRSLSNPDKHQHLSNLRSRGDWIQDGEIEITEGDDGLTGHIEGHFVVEVWFRETGSDVVDTLQLLEREVRAVIDLFKAAFDVRDELPV